MKVFYLAGQTNFGNRGCEALVRSTVDLVTRELGACTFLVPSYNISADSQQWPNAGDFGVRFVAAPAFPFKLKLWARWERFHRAGSRRALPTRHAPDENTKRCVGEADAVIMIGGDVISLDYGIAPLLWNTGVAEYAISQSKPVILWAASVGPFGKEPAVERYMSKFLQRLDAISVRETFTQSYLDSIGVGANLHLVSDPAFVLSTEENKEVEKYWVQESAAGVLGFNISPLIQKFRPLGEDPNVLQDEVVAFLRYAIEERGLSVVLIPHVDSLDGSVEGTNQDSAYMSVILSKLGGVGARVSMLPKTLNACQLKYAISKCRYFIGGRTHSTIAALSRGVPTISIAYSVKAKGLNFDLFGNTEYVLDTPSVSRSTLVDSLRLLESRDSEIRTVLAQRIPVWRERALLSAKLLSQILLSRHGKRAA